jgi:hypothetical protein
MSSFVMHFLDQLVVSGCVPLVRISLCGGTRESIFPRMAAFDVCEQDASPSDSVCLRKY